LSVVVSDASPLINLARVNQFHVLATLYGQIVIPQDDTSHQRPPALPRVTPLFSHIRQKKEVLK
jgi:predicted nucleic acid-binding protein